MAGVGGFPPETFRFLRELRANNRKDWFDAHRADYEAFCLAPAKAFVVAAGGPAARFLRHRALFVHRDEPHTAAILAVCAGHWRALAPLHRWLTDNVQEPAAAGVRRTPAR